MQRYCEAQTLESVPCSLPSPCSVLVQMTLGLQQLQSTTKRPALLSGLPLMTLLLIANRAVNQL